MNRRFVAARRWWAVLPLLVATAAEAQDPRYYSPYGGYVVVDYTIRITDRETITRRGPNGYSVSETVTRQTIGDGRHVTENSYYRESLYRTPTEYDWQRNYGSSIDVRPAQTRFYYPYGSYYSYR